MRVVELWRFPVKSLQGERLTATEVEREGIAGDRRWALFDVAPGFGLTARREPALLFGSAKLTGDGGVEVVLPDGSTTTDDAVLSDWLGRPVALRAAADVAGRRYYEAPEDDLTEDGTGRTGRWYPWMGGGGGAFHDNGDARLSLVSTASLGEWDRRRIRANVVLDGEGEERLIGFPAMLGSVYIGVGDPISRCVMVTRPQPGGIDRDTGVLRTIHRERGGELAVGARVFRPGRVAVGDALEPA